MNEGEAWIQWKGSDICLDLTCPLCGYGNHYDGGFAYNVRCKGCRRVWELCPDISVALVAVKAEDGRCILEDETFDADLLLDQVIVLPPGEMTLGVPSTPRLGETYVEFTLLAGDSKDQE